MTRRYNHRLISSAIILFLVILKTEKYITAANEFGNPTYDFTLDDFEGTSLLSVSKAQGSYFTDVANPEMTSPINPSPKVAMYERNGNKKWAKLTYELDVSEGAFPDASLFMEDWKMLFLDMYTENAPIGSMMQLYLENSTMVASCGYSCGRHSRYDAYTTKQGEWERLRFNFAKRLKENVADDWIDQITFQLNGRSYTSYTYLLDNFNVYNAATQAPSNVPSIVPSQFPSSIPSVAPTNSISPTMAPSTRPSPAPFSVDCYPGTGGELYSWKGFEIGVKEGRCGPHGLDTTLFHRDNVDYIADLDEFELSIAQHDLMSSGEWSGSEIRIVRPWRDGPFRYGTFTFGVGDVRVVDTNGVVLQETLPPNVVLGMFTYDPNDGGNNFNHEVDLEMSQWGDATAEDMQFAVKPSNGTYEKYRFYSGDDHGSLYAQSQHNHSITWTPGSIIWQSTAGKIQTKTYSTDNALSMGWNDYVQCLPSDTEVRINLRMHNNSHPMNVPNGGKVQVTITNFAYTESSESYILPGSQCSKQCQCEYGCIDDGTGFPKCSSTPIHPIAGEQPIVVTAGSGVLLAKSNVNELMILSRVTVVNGFTSTGVPAGRSYDGNEWESVHPLLFSFDCSFDNACHVMLPEVPNETTVHYIIETFISSELTPQESAARLLIQTTFGPTKSSISTTSQLSSPKKWLMDQMLLPMTSLRAHYRQRTGTQLRDNSDIFSFWDPCDVGSRWNRFAFSIEDVGKTFTAELLSNGNVLLEIDGLPRTEVPYTDLAMVTIDPPYAICYVNEYVGGGVMIVTQGSMMFGVSCTDTEDYNIIDNPAITFEDQNVINSIGASDAHLMELSPTVRDVKLLQLLESGSCTFSATGALFVKDLTGDNDGEFYIHSRRMKYVDNTLGSSIIALEPTGRSRFCPKAPKTFLNEESCQVLTTPVEGDNYKACVPPLYDSKLITLDAPTLRQFYELDRLYVYRINNLRIQDDALSPCQGHNSKPFRFVRRDAVNDVNGGCAGVPGVGGETMLSESTKNVLRNTIESALAEFDANKKENIRVLDIFFPADSCSDSLSLGAHITVQNAGCWTHSHPAEWNVYEMTHWVLDHDGNPGAYSGGRPNPIANIAERENIGGILEDSVTLNFPGWHPKERFDANEHKFVLLGAWGSTVDFANLDHIVQGPNMATAIGATVVGYVNDGRWEACGSHGEVGSDPMTGNQYYGYMDGDRGTVSSNTYDQNHGMEYGKHMVWNTVAFTSQDQLRLRLTWALSSIFIVTANDIDYKDRVEAWSHYYDIFSRNAFGNFYDILKEVSYNVLMGMMLTYEGSQSLASSVEDDGKVRFPDENYAREIMQLFTIGLWQLNDDGTLYLDDEGRTVPTYSNDDITNFARAWTGFERADMRTNMESSGIMGSNNLIDPMRVTSKDTRDLFPKLSLNDKGRQTYIGDSVQLCNALPPRQFLKKGARYRYLGSSRLPDLARADPNWWDNNDAAPQLVLNPESSELYAALCRTSDTNSRCQFQSTVILTNNLNCDGSCVATATGGSSLPCECSIDKPRVVRLDPPNSQTPVYYEYVPAPCVQLAFTEDEYLQSVGMIGYRSSNPQTYPNNTMCADVRLAVATSACCDVSSGSSKPDPRSNCVFQGERVTFATAMERCEAEGRVLCDSWDPEDLDTQWACGTDFEKRGTHSKAGLRYAWSNSSCSIKVRIEEKGQVAIVHESSLPFPTRQRVALDSPGTFFGVLWGGNDDVPYPTVATGCDTEKCVVYESTCLCETTVDTVPLFDGTYFPDVGRILEKLHVGAPDPATFDTGIYTVCETPICQVHQHTVMVHLRAESGAVDEDATRQRRLNADILPFDEHTIFEIKQSQGPSLFLSNRVSYVSVGKNSYFRNPPVYHSLIDPSRHDALYETDAVLSSFGHHSNTAPFVATKLIQALVTSNPSPRYVAAVSRAFRTGWYDGESFGTGQYGDLAATVAAVVLDREARSGTLDNDPTYGSVREPFIKLLHYFRAMELVSQEERELPLNKLDEEFGQESHDAPSVFGFFLSEYQPPTGPVLEKGLVSPESQLLDAPKMVNYLNGMISLPRYGLNSCEKGFGSNNERFIIKDQSWEGTVPCRTLGDYNDTTAKSPFRLGYTPSCVKEGYCGATAEEVAATIVSEMDLLLTAGRLDPLNQEIIENACSEIVASEENFGLVKAVAGAQQLFAATPEFQITNRLFSRNSSNLELEVRNVTEEVLDLTEPENVTDYKAIVYLYMGGAMDSYSLLVPHSNCTVAPELVHQYMNVRGDIAIDPSDLHPVNATDSDQPCDTFGIHPSMTILKELYDSRMASFVANMGPLVEPIANKEEFKSGLKELPQSLFAHNTQKQVTQTVYAQDVSTDGILGRIGDAVNMQAQTQAQEDVFDGYSIKDTPKVLEGKAGVSRVADVLDSKGVVGLSSPADNIQSLMKELNKHVATSIFGETFSDKIVSTFSRIDALGKVLGSSTLVNGDCASEYADTSIGHQLQQVARVISSRNALKAKRDVFYVEQGGYDTHSDNGPRLTSLLSDVNNALRCFVDELIAQEIWANVTIVQASEFARTLTSNGLGTDHAWGGNYFILGGSVAGGKIHGQYPSDLTEDGPLNVGRGRLIPTTPWEGLWKGVAEWFDVDQENMAKVLPNLENFDEVEHVIATHDLFVST